MQEIKEHTCVMRFDAVDCGDVVAAVKAITSNVINPILNGSIIPIKIDSDYSGVGSDGKPLHATVFITFAEVQRV